MKAIVSLVSVLVAAAAWSAPTAAVTSVTQDAATGIVTVDYTLSEEDAVVTFDVLTNGVSVGLGRVRRVWGDVNCRVARGSRSLMWNSRDNWSDGIVLADCQFAVKAWSLANPPDYMAINAYQPSNILFYAGADALPCAPTSMTMKTAWMLMRKIPAAGVRWRMGSTADDTLRNEANEVPHYVTLDHDYYMGVYKVTMNQYYSIMNGSSTHGAAPAGGMGVEMIRGATADYDWPDDGHKADPTKFIGKLQAHAGIDSMDLPTEAQWEYACRAGTSSPRYNGKDVSHLPEIAWYDHKTGTQEVGLLEPNAWGLYDMYGNLFELCLDWFSKGDAFCREGDEVSEPKGPQTGGTRVYRGCSYSHGNSYARSASRDGQAPNSPYTTLGARLCCRADFLSTRASED